MENRNYFSLHCIQMETQLIHSNMMMLHTALVQMASVETSSYAEVGNSISLPLSPPPSLTLSPLSVLLILLSNPPFPW